MQISIRLKAAQHGHKLLETKVQALEVKFRRLAVPLTEARINMATYLTEAYFSHAEAKFHHGEFHDLVLNSVTVGEVPQISITHRIDNVAGVNLPMFEVIDDGIDKFELIGLGKGGYRLSNVKGLYRKVIDLLGELTTMQCMFTQLEDVIQTTKRRVHALENVVIPRLQNTLSYITAELDEMEREDFYRLKMIKRKKVVKPDIPEIEENGGRSPRLSIGEIGTEKQRSIERQYRLRQKEIKLIHEKMRKESEGDTSTGEH